MGLLESLAVRTLPLVPRPIMRRLAGRYIAGEELPEALAKLAQLAGTGHAGILDILGEEVKDEREARTVLDEYREAAGAIAARKLDAHVSAKPTHFGLRLGEDLCHELYASLAALCAELGLFVRVEMEDNTTTDATLRVFGRLRAEHANVGIVLQSRLFRTPADVEALGAVSGAGPLDVRMVKGIYLEPAAIAHTEPVPIRRAYVELSKRLFELGARVSLATHDDVMALELIAHARRAGLTPERYEFQVLLGVRESLWKEWRDDGHEVRVYVPFGPEWRAYSQRRLRKNPEILRHVMRQTLGLSG